MIPFLDFRILNVREYKPSHLSLKKLSKYICTYLKPRNPSEEIGRGNGIAIGRLGRESTSTSAKDNLIER